jgi:UDP-glucose-4-epimerase GalE
MRISANPHANAAKNGNPAGLFHRKRPAASRRAWKTTKKGKSRPTWRVVLPSLWSGPAGDMSQAILVTGGAGYVGSHACKVLARAGYRPVVFDNLSRGRREAVRWGPLVEGDLADTAQLSAVLAEHRVSAVMHFAAYAYVGESVAEPALYYRNNLGGTLSLLEAMRDAGVGEIVFSSTCATYGTPEAVPIREDSPQRPVNPYGETKLAVERALYWYGQAYGVRSAALRYFNAAGADPEGEIGECHEPETHLVPLVLQAALGQRPRIDIYGTDYPTPDGTAIRDYVHVQDLAVAHLRALERLREDGGNIAVNLGTGHGRSVQEVIAAAEAATGRKVPAQAAPRRPGDPPALVADPSLAAAILGWRPQHSDLDTIIRTALAWQTRQLP